MLPATMKLTGKVPMKKKVPVKVVKDRKSSKTVQFISRTNFQKVALLDAVRNVFTEHGTAQVF